MKAAAAAKASAPSTPAIRVLIVSGSIGANGTAGAADGAAVCADTAADAAEGCETSFAATDVVGLGAAGAVFCAVLGTGTSGQRVATGGAAFQTDPFVDGVFADVEGPFTEVAALALLPAAAPGATAGGLATALS